MCISRVQATTNKIQVLFVGGDWKEQIETYRGHFVEKEVAKVAPDEFTFTHWTTYEFLQYAEPTSLRPYDVIVAGDFMAGAMMPRVIKAVESFVADGGGFMYCDNHKAFMFSTREVSFENVLPIEMPPFRPYSPEGMAPYMDEKPLKIMAAQLDHAIMAGLSWSNAPALDAAHAATVKTSGVVLATTPAGKPLWVVGEVGKGRSLWAGGVFANDEMSEHFSKWPQFGKFYAQSLRWLAEHRHSAATELKEKTADATLIINPEKIGPALSARHFGVTDSREATHDGLGKDLYQALNLDGALEVTTALPTFKAGVTASNTDLSDFNPTNFDTGNEEQQLEDAAKADKEQIFSYGLAWFDPNSPTPFSRTGPLAAALVQANGAGITNGAQRRVNYFALSFDWHHWSLSAETFPQFTALFNHFSDTLRPRAPGVQFGCGDFPCEWPYMHLLIDQCGTNLNWITRHVSGRTGEATFMLEDEYAAYAKEKGLKDLKFMITEWEFWGYGRPAFDFIMQRWKPLADRADVCLATMQYHWVEYAQGGYVHGLIGKQDGSYGERPVDWPNPGKNKPVTYRYNGFWIMRDCRGPQLEAQLDVPDLKCSACQRAYAIATTNKGALNVVIYFGYPLADYDKGQLINKLKVKINVPLPPEIKGHSLTISRADARTTSEEAPQLIKGDTLTMDIEIPECSAVSLTVR